MADKKLILAVDDDASVCDLYETSLAVLGYDVMCASSGGKAKEALKKRKPDVILMDIMMSDQDGISLTRDIRSDPETAHIPIIIVSGLSDAATLNDALLFGAADYLVKPLDMDVLKGKLEHALALKKK
ncbi:MAG: response regulator [Elusimicrobia bacterium]|nr:response regulator [Elusimicrobiota bacterium]